MSNGYLRKVHRYAEDALVQFGVVSRCEQHRDVLLHHPEYEDSPVPYNLADVWLKQHEDIEPMREDLLDAIKGILDGAPSDGCTACAKRPADVPTK